MQEPLKIAYIERMYRYCRPQKGRLREFHQVGTEFFGQHYTIDIQAISMAVSFLSKLKLLEYVVLNLNTIGGPDTRAKYSIELGQYFEQNKDKIAYLHTNPLRTLDKLSDAEKASLADMPIIYDYLTTADKEYFQNILNGLDMLGIKYQINNSIVRGLDYYSHIVFEFTTSATTAQNTVLAGGRYDKLISEISSNQSNSAIGWGAGIERLMILSQECLADKILDKASVLFINMNCDFHALSVCNRLREYIGINMITVDKLKTGLNIANKHKYVHVIICGEQELQSGKMLYKNMHTSDQKNCSIDEMIELLR